MKSLTLYITLLFFAIVTCLTSCVREDDEPVLEKISISRLYVSLSEYNLDEAQTPYNNVDIIDRADSSESFKSSLPYNSGIKGGAGILFSPTAKFIFQSSANGNNPAIHDTIIQVMTINPNTGAPASGGLISNRFLTNVKGLAYHYNKGSENLYASNIGNDNNSSFIYLFQKPGSFRGRANFKQRISLGALIPWTMAFKSTEDNSDLLMSVTGTKKGIAIFSGILAKNPEIDSVLTDTQFPPKAVLTIANHGEVRGFSYSARQDLLAVACYTAGSPNVGRILLFEKASSLLSATGDRAIEPTRIITGSETGLVKPLDVAIDNRDGAKYLYVADGDKKTVSRFLLTDKDNIKPNKTRLYNLTPVALSLDARGPGEDF